MLAHPVKDSAKNAGIKNFIVGFFFW